MLRENMIVITLLCVGHGFAAQSVVNMNFYEAYQASQGELQLYLGGKSPKNNEKAYETYSTLAAETSDSELATLARARAAVAFGLQEGNYTQGLERATAVADRPLSVQLKRRLNSPTPSNTNSGYWIFWLARCMSGR
ncbi:MAG: hypothetical protein LC725_01320 [Lentisphaerae bacterium]|nr:hypothetical protein [Lentisphaerota bacterium]